jgi:dipeptidyl aminopeptidase/acylaminoacyl peptidase
MSPDRSLIATFYCQVIPTKGKPKSQAVLAIWNREGNKIMELPTAFDKGPDDIAFSPDMSLLAVAGGCSGCSVEVFDLKKQARVSVLQGHVSPRDPGVSEASKPIGVTKALFSPDGKCLATGGGDGCVRLWSIPKFEEILRLDQHSERLDRFVVNFITGLAFSPDGKSIVSASCDGKVIIWEAKTGQLVRTIQARPFPKGKLILDLDKLLVTVAISPDATRLATADIDRVALWDLTSGNLLDEERKALPSILVLAFSPDGSELIAPSRTGGVLRWDVVSDPKRLKRK